jgi:predicted site-specific integrase-resolvase
MTNFDAYEDDLDAIRVKLYEQTKEMTSEEHTEFFRNIAQTAAKKYGFSVVNDISEGMYAFEKKLYGEKIAHASQQGSANHTE